MASSKNILDEFWKQNDGKLIRSYGKWLIVYGIIVFLGCGFWIFYILSQYSLSDLTGLGIAVLCFYTTCLATAVYYIYAGAQINNRKFSPNQISNTSTIVITLVIITAVCSALLSIQLGGTTVVLLGILDIVTLVDSIRYKNSWHKNYCNAYNGKKYSKQLKAPSIAKKDTVSKKEEKDSGDEYYDDEL